MEYIERETLWRAFEYEPFYDNADRDEIVLPKIDSFPAADVAQVVHGRWIMRGGKFRCSECDAKANWKREGGTGGFSFEYEQVKSTYCHNCGAKMDLK